ncbi:Myb DNA-bind 3 domain-containing protein [Citrus sinensis]|uniref:Myb DNA-bind 3 domain-containing protein n=2 Tax=Citrus sinensis TaxID=2711 RepID=A0ACB8LGM6_CITSI|nr:Myb DNA-bind 3 domain-containing protein [Citrus sinensis]
MCNKDPHQPPGMEEDGGASHTIGNKAGTRRAWTYVEEEALLDALDAVVVSGGRADNGFKSGTFIHLEKLINQKLPNCGLKASPHIDSKIRKWKKQYGLMFDMLNTSGFGWNDVKKCVEVDSDEVWNSYVQFHNAVRNWRGKPFPLYERLANIFGKDRATGHGAQTPADMEDEANQEEIRDDDNEMDDGCSPISATPPSSSQHTARAHSQPPSRKRSRSEGDLQAGIDKIANLISQSFENMNTIAQRMFDNKEDRFDISDELATMGLSVEEELLALELILKEPHNISVFKSSRGERKVTFVHMLLHRAQG